MDLIPAEWWFPYLHKILLFAEDGIGDGVHIDQVIALLQLLTHLIIQCPCRTIQLTEMVIRIGFDACVFAGRIRENQSSQLMETVNTFWLMLCQLQPTLVCQYLQCFYIKLDKELEKGTLAIRKEDVFDVRPWLRKEFIQHSMQCKVCTEQIDKVQQILI